MISGSWPIRRAFAPDRPKSYPTAMREIAILRAPWREPIEVLAACADRPHALALLSDGQGARGRWSYVMQGPARMLTVAADDPRDPFAAMKDLLGETAGGASDGPPFQGGLAGLLSYDLGARLEPAGHPGGPDWPDVACGLYLGLLAFDHDRHGVLAVGRGADAAEAEANAKAAIELLGLPQAPPPAAPLSPAFDDITAGADYEAAVAAVVERIAAGEIFQANIARRWGGRLRPGTRPVDLVRRLVTGSPAPFAAYFKLPGRAVVSNSPERFLAVSDDGGLIVETRPIKGTRPRGPAA